MTRPSSPPTPAPTSGPAVGPGRGREAGLAAWRMASVSMPSSAILAVPIALAELGALAGVGVVVAIMAFKLVTLSALVEAAQRCSSYRIWGAGHGGVARQLLGRSGVLALVGSSTLYRVLSLLGALVALADLAHVRWGVPLPVVPLVVVAVVAADFARRRRVNTRVTGTLLVVVAVAVVVVAVAGVPSMEPSRWLERGSWGPAMVGAILTSFVAEAYVLNVLARGGDDPAVVAARRRGTLWGVVLVGAITSGWVLVVAALVPPQELAAATGSVAGAVEGRAGVLVVGLTSGLCSLVALINALRNVPSLGLQVQEWLPRPRRQELDVRPGVDRLVLPGPAGAVVGATVLAAGPDGVEAWVELQQPDGLVAGPAHLGVDGSVADLAPEVAVARGPLASLGLVVLHQGQGGVVVSVRTSRSRPVEVQVRPSPLRVAGAVLDDGEGAAVSRWLLRHPGATLDELAAGTGLAAPAVEAHLGELRRDGALGQEGGSGGPVRYRLRLGARARAGGNAPVRAALDALAGLPDDPAPGAGGRRRRRRGPAAAPARC